MGYGCRELYQRERERASSEKMRTKNGFKERKLYQKRKNKNEKWVHRERERALSEEKERAVQKKKESAYNKGVG